MVQIHILQRSLKLARTALSLPADSMWHDALGAASLGVILVAGLSLGGPL
ncbi:hypothetical protein [Phaeovulum vinaykumarii]|uniref:Uncharacterized protein n=1 Tax=Phaeovulum vinaykumarii TaxID=407234 RepID=A0A1N7MU94_9RHOB|nr:hypothetical protein [Phaeovulum vinaykumarii]SIS89693.1 hypothetical protein SAMN05421795_11020 [Phaeovulum vinaykumarii]SOC18270.1 hypothetical protein SAMN05878426_1145 [Phaeovulum vinaykumarii]